MGNFTPTPSAPTTCNTSPELDKRVSAEICGFTLWSARAFVWCFSFANCLLLPPCSTRSKERRHSWLMHRGSVLACLYCQSVLCAAIGPSICSKRYKRWEEEKEPTPQNLPSPCSWVFQTATCELWPLHWKWLYLYFQNPLYNISYNTGPIFIHTHPPTPENTLLGVGGV